MVHVIPGNNKIYTLKEMIQHLDRVHFEKDIFEEVKVMFVNNIWAKFSS